MRPLPTAGWRKPGSVIVIARLNFFARLFPLISPVNGALYGLDLAWFKPPSPRRCKEPALTQFKPTQKAI
jgi:hypothetical protein